MRKSTIFISAVLTTFALVILYGVVSVYQSMSNLPEATALPTDTVAPEPEVTLEPTATQAVLTPEEAAQLAAKVVGNPNLLSAESSSVKGTNAYKITFTNNDVVCVRRVGWPDPGGPDCACGCKCLGPTPTGEE